jgi:raffinose/stachyose/melibiose transport system permease protein
MWTGTYLILFHANMQKIDIQILEAAEIDGASEMQVMRLIVVPSLSGVILNATILCISGSLSGFALILAMTGRFRSRSRRLSIICTIRHSWRPIYHLAKRHCHNDRAVQLALILIIGALEKRSAGWSRVVESQYG